MPRIRTLKPEHRQHRKVGPLSDRTYRLWVGMILEADDEGRLVCDAAQLRALVFAYHPKVPIAAIEASLAALETTGLIRLYTVAGLRYADFPSWHDHQRIDHKMRSKLPEYQHSSNDTGMLASEPRTLPPEGKGKDLEGKGTTLSGSPPDAASLGSNGHEHGPAAMSTAARKLLAFLNTKTGKHFQPIPTNLDMITARLREGATFEQCWAIIGMKTAEWKGDAKMCKYLRPETLFNRTHFASYQGELPATAFTEDQP